MSFIQEIDGFRFRFARGCGEFHEGLVADARSSIRDGSEVTGAPGQPFRTGKLYGSWVVMNVEPLVDDVVTDSLYAFKVERALQKNTTGVGGAFSLKLTARGFRRLVAARRFPLVRRAA